MIGDNLDVRHSDPFVPFLLSFVLGDLGSFEFGVLIASEKDSSQVFIFLGKGSTKWNYKTW